MTLLRLRSSINPVGFAVSHSADSLSPASFLELPLNTFCIISYHLSRHNKGRRTSAHARQKQRNECFEKKTTSGLSSAGLTLLLQTAQYSRPLLIKVLLYDKKWSFSYAAQSLLPMKAPPFSFYFLFKNTIILQSQQVKNR